MVIVGRRRVGRVHGEGLAEGHGALHLERLVARLRRLQRLHNDARHFLARDFARNVVALVKLQLRSRGLFRERTRSDHGVGNSALAHHVFAFQLEREDVAQLFVHAHCRRLFAQIQPWSVGSGDAGRAHVHNVRHHGLLQVRSNAGDGQFEWPRFEFWIQFVIVFEFTEQQLQRRNPRGVEGRGIFHRSSAEHRHKRREWELNRLPLSLLRVEPARVAHCIPVCACAHSAGSHSLNFRLSAIDTFLMSTKSKSQYVGITNVLTLHN